MASGESKENNVIADVSLMKNDKATDSNSGSNNYSGRYL